MKTVTVFGSSIPGPKTALYAEALRLGRLLAENGVAVSNGGYGGLMEATARGAHEAGGHTIGVTCSLWPLEANGWIEEEIRAPSFTERIMTLIESGDAYIVLPGGTGTLAELALVWEMMNKSSLSRTVGGRKPLLVMAPYWQPVVECLRQEAQLGVPSREMEMPALEIITLVASVEQAVAKLKAHWRT
jgi:uncharacterized protein (TIGR00730 family)